MGVYYLMVTSGHFLYCGILCQVYLFICLVGFYQSENPCLFLVHLVHIHLK